MTRPSRASSKRWRIVGSLIVVLAALAVAAPLLLGVRFVAGTTGPLPETARVLEDRWSGILDGAVAPDGTVDYARIATREPALARLVDAIARMGPETTPALFPEHGDRLAYGVNAYNALVVYAIVSRRVHGGVHDVHGPIEPASGMGFFWGLRFGVDGATTNLRDLENDVLRARFSDARIHAAINCASRACPVLAPEAYRGPTIDAELDAAATRFASTSPHVVIDDGEREIVLSQIYDWYANDFARDAAHAGEERSALGWIHAHATPNVRATLDRARDRGDAVRFTPYDWSLDGHW